MAIPADAAMEAEGGAGRGPERPGSNGARTALTIVLAVVLAVGAWFGVQWLLRTVDGAPTADHGYVYETDGYSVQFPDQPTIDKQRVPGTTTKTDLVSWENRRKSYIATYLPSRGPGATIESVTRSALAGGNGKAVHSKPYEVTGGFGRLTTIDDHGKKLWLLVAFPAKADGCVLLTYSGPELDRAFFSSLKLR
ncbi:hypothetical protein [Microbacterium sp.]|uniref:hypothetical protein n=1 Tax=Microbacterium sp. TaxID=51671 RepID=UPI003341AB6D